jgi:hypothetical protein
MIVIISQIHGITCIDVWDVEEGYLSVLVIAVSVMTGRMDIFYQQMI